ncbi:TetR family transcriptional regulator [Streptomyces sp. B1866]|uniref:TetR/AcrR family transcriptional regulator n=1 Tax=Streptomyces sp. B1866 TaxID=3075431 RepID=UPI002891146E|nr:TetR family transcriptional regulator [Streptomyces sp. B1866]MDT3400115.1 TetR family transcriptional regulator [Streptomyces sp. B1866]
MSETTTATTTFQRARRPEQREVRRQAILQAAVDMLADMPVAEISLRELSRRVGLAKSNVLRYFETREAVFLELLDRAWHDWLDALEAGELPPPPAAPLGRASAYAPVARATAESLGRRPLLCELISVLPGVLERNVSTEVVRSFKQRALGHNSRLGRLLGERIPELDETASIELASTVFTFAVGLWPLANPAPSVVAALEDPCLAGAHVDFADRLARTTELTVAGLLNRS